ncbi:MAG: hypothetical protein IPK70_15830 [Flavobacteriales bacterium]|jgi:hypothetical protein|nr:hypothetical protein [Flavobacteriales bacterium]
MKTQARRRFRRFTRKDLFELFVCIALAGLFVLLSSGAAFGQGNVGINNPAPHAKSLLDLTSSDKGLLTPRMTAAQRTAMFPIADATAKGMLVYQTDGAIGFYYYDGAAWQMLQAGGTGWGLLGNAGTNPATNFIGTTDNQGFAIRTNNTERVSVAQNGKVGIGITTPNWQLDVLDNSTATGQMAIRNLNGAGWSSLNIFNHNLTGHAYFGMHNPTGVAFAGTATASPFALYTTGLPRLHVTAVGDIGIGTLTPSRLLEVSSASQAVQRIASNNAANGSVLELSNATAGNNNLGAINFLEGNTPLGQFAYHKTDGMVFRTGGPERMRIDVNGNVGIGTTAPSSKLHVSRGAAGYAPNANSGLTVEHSGNVYANVISATGETGVLFGSAANAAHGGIVYNSVWGLTLRTGGNLERMRIDANGNVGIGTNAPGVKLDVVDGNWLIPMRVRNTLPTGYSAVQYINNNNKYGNIGWGNSAAATFADKFYVGTTSPEPMLFTTGDVERARIDAAGNVGIGTAAPATKLHVAADQAAGMAMTVQNLNAGGWSGTNYLSSAGAGSNTVGFDNSTQNGFLGTTTNHPVTFISNWTERMRIAANGNVGIGTAAPTSALEVNGFTKLGSSAPAVRMLKLTGTTAGTEGGFVDLPHGITGSKILGVEVLIEYTPGNWISDNYMLNPEYQANYVVNATNIRLLNHVNSSGSILSKPVKILITYEA